MGTKSYTVNTGHPRVLKLTRPVGVTYFLLEATTCSTYVVRCFAIKLGRDGLLLIQLLRGYRVASLGGSFSIGIRGLHRCYLARL